VANDETSDLRGIWKKIVVNYLKYQTGIQLKGQRKPPKVNLSQDN
jgi:hypothetical protein